MCWCEDSGSNMKPKAKIVGTICPEYSENSVHEKTIKNKTKQKKQIQPHTTRKSGWSEQPKVPVILTDCKLSCLISPCTAMWCVFLNYSAKTFCHFWSITLILTIRLPLAFWGERGWGGCSKQMLRHFINSAVLWWSN